MKIFDRGATRAVPGPHKRYIPHRRAAFLGVLALALAPITGAQAGATPDSVGPPLISPVTADFQAPAPVEHSIGTCGTFPTQFTQFDQAATASWGATMGGELFGQVHGIGVRDFGTPWMMTGGFTFRRSGVPVFSGNFEIPGVALDPDHVQARGQVVAKNLAQDKWWVINLLLELNVDTGEIAGSLGETATSYPLYAVEWNRHTCAGSVHAVLGTAEGTFSAPKTQNGATAICTGEDTHSYKSNKNAHHLGPMTDNGSFVSIDGTVNVGFKMTEDQSVTSPNKVMTVTGVWQSTGDASAGKIKMVIPSSRLDASHSAGVGQLTMQVSSQLTLYANVLVTRYTVLGGNVYLDGAFGTNTAPDEPLVSRYWNTKSCI